MATFKGFGDSFGLERGARGWARGWFRGLWGRFFSWRNVAIGSVLPGSPREEIKMAFGINSNRGWEEGTSRGGGYSELLERDEPHLTSL